MYREAEPAQNCCQEEGRKQRNRSRKSRFARETGWNCCYPEQQSLNVHRALHFIADGPRFQCRGLSVGDWRRGAQRETPALAGSCAQIAGSWYSDAGSRNLPSGQCGGGCRSGFCLPFRLVLETILGPIKI